MNIDPQTYYKLIAKSSGKCLDVTGGASAVANNGARLQQYDYLGGDNQKWRFQEVGGGYYEIVVKNSTKCLDVIGGPGATRNGVGIQLYDYWGGGNQQWRLEDVDNGTVAIIAENSGKCLDVIGGPGATGNGVQVQQWDCLGGDNQKWAPIAVETTSKVQPAFPITASQDDNFPGSGGFMHTDANIFSSGLLNGVTHTWEITQLRGFGGAVAVLALDQNLNPLWVSSTHQFGVDGRLIGTSDRTDNWSETIPVTILPQIRYIALIQKWNQSNVFDDIQKWLKGVTDLATELDKAIKAIATVVTTVGAL